MAYALVTGASKGIGKAIAVELAKKKFDLLLTARSADALGDVASVLTSTYKIKADFLPLDLSAPDAPAKLYGWCESKGYTIQVLVNNAGYGLSGSFAKYSPEQNRDMMQLNMLSLVALCQLFLADLKKSSRGYILNVASSAAYQAVPGLTVYAATKAFVLRFSRGLRQELHGSGVSVTCVSPGSTDTDFPKRAEIGEKGMKAAAKVNMTPEDVARMAVKAMLAGKTEIITGAVNKAGAFLAWLLPGTLVERTAMKVYQ